MRHHIHTHSTNERMTEKDWPDFDARNLAEDAEAFRRNYATITAEQARDLGRVADAVNDVLAAYYSQTGHTQ